MEQCLNAYTVLIELIDNDVTYELLLEQTVVSDMIEASCDNNNPNQAYATHVFANLIKDFPEHEKSIEREIVGSFQSQISQGFFDLTYSNLLVLKSNNDSSDESNFMENTCGLKQSKFGLRRTRAIELIRYTIQTLSKMVDLNSGQYISKILKRQLIDGMLYVIKQYSFCSISS